MYFGCKQFFDAVSSIGNTFVDNTAYCNRLIASRLNLEFSFNGEMKLIADGAELLREVVAAAKAGKFTQSDADFATSQLLRIGLVYNSFRTVYHVQAYESLVEKPVVESDVSHLPVMEDVNQGFEKEISEEILTSQEDVANIKEPAKRGRKAAK
jgi:hypothetical protein